MKQNFQGMCEYEACIWAKSWLLVYYYIINKYNSMTCDANLKKHTHFWVFRRPQIALVLWTRAIWKSLKNSLVQVISKLHEKSCYYLHIADSLNFLRARNKTIKTFKTALRLRKKKCMVKIFLGRTAQKRDSWANIKPDKVRKNIYIPCDNETFCLD